MERDELLRRAGALADAYAAVEWAAGPLGAVETWSEALVAAVDLVLASRVPISLFWGEDLIQLYNEAYVELIGEKHPVALGAPLPEVFPEAWDDLEPLVAQARTTGGVAVQDASIPLVRRGFLEECYFTFGYSAVRGVDGRVEGLIDIAIETTRAVVEQRRMAVLVELEDRLADVPDELALVKRATTLLEADAADFAGVELRLGDEGGRASRAADVELLAGPDGDRLAVIPVRSPGRQAEVMARLGPMVYPDAECLRFLGLVGSAIGSSLDRLTIRQQERRLSVALQRSLLTEPVAGDGVEVAVRYLPASTTAEVGGDWFDAFRGSAGELILVVGDVVGHDQQAAVVMAQVRNLLRGVAFASGADPATVLEGVDAAMSGLALESFATAVVATVRDGRLRWSNGGHPPPLLLRADGSTALLDADADLVLGIGGAGARSEHQVPLQPGDGLLLFTDGLVERRGASLTDGLGWLARLLAGRQELDADALCALVLDAIGPVEDDVALLAVRVSARG